MAGQGGPPGGAAVTRCRRGSAGPGGRADGTWGSRPRPPARRTGQQPHVGRAHRRRRNGLPAAARPGPGPVPGGCGPGMPRARPAIGWTGTGQSWRAGAGMPVAPAHRRRTGRGPGLGELCPARLLDLDGAAAAAGEARSAAVSARDHAATSIAMTSLAVISENRGHLREALQIADDAVLLADQSPGRLGHRYPVHIPRGFILVALDRLDEARTTIETGRRISEEHGTRRRGCRRRVRATGQRGPRLSAPRSGDHHLRAPRRRTRPRPGRGRVAADGYPPRPPRHAPPRTKRLAEPHPQ